MEATKVSLNGSDQDFKVKIAIFFRKLRVIIENLLNNSRL